MSEHRLGDYQGRKGRIGYTFWGLVLAPMIGGAASMLIYVLPVLSFGDEESRTLLKLHAVISTGFLAGAFLGLPASLLLGPFAHLLLLRQGWTSLLHYCTFGTVIALAVQCTVMLGFSGLFVAPGTWRVALLAAIAGAIGGVAFWLIRRPDRDAPRPHPNRNSGT